MLERGGVAPYLKNLLHFKRESRKTQNDVVPLPRATVVAHEKHRPSGVKTRRRQSPPIAMYSKFCPTAPAPLRGRKRKGVKDNIIFHPL